MTMRRFLSVLLLTLSLPSSLLYARSHWNINAFRGGQYVYTGGVASATKVQASYPYATVKVFKQGSTITLAAIYSTFSGTPQVNPFTADVTGAGQFYSDEPSVDVQFSGGGLATPFTIYDWQGSTGGSSPAPSGPAFAVGDSITRGAGSTGGNTGWATLLSAANGWVLTNLAQDGAQIQDIAAQAHSLTPAAGSSYISLLGFNDERRTTGAADDAHNDSCTREVLAYLAIPNANKLLPTDSRITYSGSWSTGSPYGAKQTSTTNDTATFTIYGSAVYVASLNVSGGTGTFSVSVDGVVTGTYTCDPITATQNLLTTGTFLARIAALPDTVHTVVFKKTGGNTVYFLWAAGAGEQFAYDGPNVYVGNTLRMNSTGYAAIGGSDASVALYNKQIRNAVRDLASDGLNVAMFDAAAAYDPTITANVSGDNYHPSDTGHAVIAASARAATTGLVQSRDREASRILGGGPIYYLSLGENPAQAGTLRFSNNGSITFRNAGNTADFGQIKGDTSGIHVFNTNLAIDAGLYMDLNTGGTGATRYGFNAAASKLNLYGGSDTPRLTVDSSTGNIAINPGSLSLQSGSVSIPAGSYFDANGGGTGATRFGVNAAASALNLYAGSDTPRAKITTAGDTSVGRGIQLNTSSASKPTCDSTTRFTFWTTPGGGGVKDNVEVCAKDNADVYAWRTIY